MRDVVRAAFCKFTAPLEGVVPFLYLDTAEPRALVTIGIGNLCPLSLALTLPFVWPDGRPATKNEIAAAWTKVDARQDLAKHGGMVFGGLQGNEIRLTEAGVDALVNAKLDETDRTLRGMFDAWEDWPACAQLALISWAWAVGPHARYPRMFAALRAGDFAMAALECTINPQRGTIVTRNARNRALLLNAARVVGYHLDPDLLEWDEVLGVDDVPTLQEMPASTPLPLLNTPIMGVDVPAYAASKPTLCPPAGPLYSLDKAPDDEPPDAA